MPKNKNITSWDDVPIGMDLPFAARIVGTTPEALVKRCQKGTFPGYKEGKLWRVEKDALREHIAVNMAASRNNADDIATSCA